MDYICAESKYVKIGIIHGLKKILILKYDQKTMYLIGYGEGKSGK